MTTRSFLLAAALLAATSAAANAQGWQRNSTTVGPHGGVSTSQGSGSCSGGTCSSTQRYTGPAGNVVTRQGSTTCSGGTCRGTATYAGPAGRTATRTRTFSRN
jgi:hypothetical protein